MAKARQCAICKADCGPIRIREDGRSIGDGCWKLGEMYRGHWFVRSMKYKVDRIVDHRTRKPLAGQKDIPFPD